MSKIKRSMVILFFTCLLLVPLPANLVSAATTNTISVVTTLSFIAELTQEIGGPYVTVAHLVPGLGSPHSFEPTIKHLKLFQDTDLFVQVGLGLEPWSMQLINSLDQAGLTVVSLGQEPNHNPHIWLDEPNLIQAVQRIQKALSELMPAEADGFASRARAFLERVHATFSEYRQEMPFKGTAVVTAVPTYSYLLADFGLRELGPLEDGHGDQPSAKEVAQLVNEARAAKAVAVISEQGFDHGFGSILAQETGLPLVILSPLPRPNEDYLTFLRRNLQTLIAAIGESHK